MTGCHCALSWTQATSVTTAIRGLLGPDAGEQAELHVRIRPVRPGLRQDGDGLIERQRVARPSLAAPRSGHQIGHIPADHDAGLRLADGSFQGAMELMEAGCGEHLGEPVQPVVDLIRGESLDLESADVGDEVLVDEDPVPPGRSTVGRPKAADRRRR